MKSYEIRVQRLHETPCAPRIETPAHAEAYWREVITGMPWFIADREVCVSLALNTRLRITGHSLVSVGTLNETVVHAREVFRAAVALNAWGVVLMHNHPGGDTTPSDADRRITRRLQEAAAVLQIGLHDHVIVGGVGANPGWFSFREAGLL